MSFFTSLHVVLCTISFTVALLHFFAWVHLRRKIEYLIFTIVAISAGTLSLIEVKILSELDPGLYSTLLKWYHLPLATFLISTIWFINIYFRHQKRTLVLFFTGLWTVCLIINFSVNGNLTMYEITSIDQVEAFNGESYSVISGNLNPWRHIADVASILFLIYVVQATIKQYKLGFRRSALTVGGSVLLFMLISGTMAPLADIGVLRIPIFLSWPFLFIVLATSAEIIFEIVKVNTLSQSLDTEKANWNNLLNKINLPVVRVDRNGIVQYVNKSMAKICGYEDKEMIGEKWLETFIPSTDRDELRKSFEVPIQDSFPAYYQNGIITRNKEIRMLSWSNIGLHNNDKQLESIIAIGADITERENAYREIVKLKEKLELENEVLKSHVSHTVSSKDIICHSDVITYAFDKAKQVADVDSIVLLEGETGVGKGVFANYIHSASKRKEKPFIVVNCAAIPADLIESELFGFEKGAFTGAMKMRRGRFEMANGGTIFLDEIAELPLALQAKLLRVIQENEFERLGGEKTIQVDVRIIVATNKVLSNEVKASNFREDLYYRINVFPITVPPLRKRREDIPKLVDYFVQHYAKKYNKNISKVSKHTYLKFAAYDWPGNVRELQNLIERAVISAKGDVLKTNGLLPDTEKKAALIQNTIRSLETVEREHIISVLKECKWQVHGKSGAAEILGINPSTLRSRMKKLNIEKPEVISNPI